MGFFDDLQSPVGDMIAGADETATGFSNPKPGSYYFVFQGVELKTNTGKNKDGTGLVFHFGLEDADGGTHNYSQYMPVPQPADPRNPSEQEVRQAAYLKKMLMDLGTPESEINTVDSDDLIGVTGSLKLVENKGYTNTRDITLKAKADKPVAKAAAQPARKAPAQRRAQPLPTTPTEAPADENEQEFEEPPVVAQPKAKPTQVAGNPFAR